MSTIPIKTYGLPYIYNYCFFILSYKIYNTTVTTPDIKNTSNAHRFIPIKSVHSTAEIPPSISTIVYLADIFAPQYLHLPLRLIQEIIGIRSFLTSSCLHVVHMDFPKENCIPRGSLYITTLRNEKMIVPSIKSIIYHTT